MYLRCPLWPPTSGHLNQLNFIPHNEQSVAIKLKAYKWPKFERSTYGRCEPLRQMFAATCVECGTHKYVYEADRQWTFKQWLRTASEWKKGLMCILHYPTYCHYSLIIIISILFFNILSSIMIYWTIRCAPYACVIPLTVRPSSSLLFHNDIFLFMDRMPYVCHGSGCR